MPVKQQDNFLSIVVVHFFIMCTNLYSFGIGGGNSPTITITSPTTDSIYYTTSGSLDLAGNVGYLYSPSSLSVTWRNDRGGSGTASGTLSWAVNGISLQVGQNLITVTVLASIGNGSSVGTEQTLIVIFTPPPTISITSPTSGQRLNNSLITIHGTAAGVAQPGNVLYQLNGGAWNSAAGTTNWSATVSLAPGTNTIRTYAVDTNGNTSLTNSVSFDYVVINQLNVRAIGLGKINPNYSNAWLEVGRKYTITAAPAKNFVFANWTISTNWIDGVKSPSSTLQFTMQSNLTLEAHFAETTIPKITVKSPKVTKPLVTLTGKASDVWGVAAVWYQLNGGAWNLATTTDNWKNWTATLPLVSGVNIISAYSVNLGGKMSSIKTLKAKSNNTFKFQLGLTSANPKSNGGMNFSLQAPPELTGTIQVSTDLVSWQTLTNFVGSSSIINFCDTTCTNYHQRFYRAVTSAP